jgi:hypothetical protein
VNGKGNQIEQLMLSELSELSEITKICNFITDSDLLDVYRTEIIELSLI